MMTPFELPLRGKSGNSANSRAYDSDKLREGNSPKLDTRIATFTGFGVSGHGFKPLTGQHEALHRVSVEGIPPQKSLRESSSGSLRGRLSSARPRHGRGVVEISCSQAAPLGFPPPFHIGANFWKPSGEHFQKPNAQSARFFCPENRAFSGKVSEGARFFSTSRSGPNSEKQTHPKIKVKHQTKSVQGSPRGDLIAQGIRSES